MSIPCKELALNSVTKFFCNTIVNLGAKQEKLEGFSFVRPPIFFSNNKKPFNSNCHVTAINWGNSEP